MQNSGTALASRVLAIVLTCAASIISTQFTSASEGAAVLGGAKPPKTGELFVLRNPVNRAAAVRDGGGSAESEAAVELGLKWIARTQLADGRWLLNDPALPANERATVGNDVAATAFGLLPLLAAGKTHKAAKGNDYAKAVEKGLQFLLRSQDKKTGYFGSNMYTHGIATIALAEAYGMTKDPALQPAAQAAVNLIVNTQHENGGWRYGPVKTATGDMSIAGWQVMALTVAKSAGLTVPDVVRKQGIVFVDSCCNVDEGYCYTPRGSTTVRMTAVGLLCREHLQNWGPKNPRMAKAIDGIIKKNPPNRQDVYYTYYATQMMHQRGGEEWKIWNGAMRDFLIAKQNKTPKTAEEGSWNAAGDPWGRAGGRLMVTSLNLLTLEVYYRYPRVVGDAAK